MLSCPVQRSESERRKDWCAIVGWICVIPAAIWWLLYSNLSAIEYDNEAKADWNIATCLTIAHGDLDCTTRKNRGDYCDNPNIFCRVLDEASGLNYTAFAYQRPSCRASGVPADCELEKSDAKQWLKTFPVGDFSNCWYNPDNPKMVALENNDEDQRGKAG